MATWNSRGLRGSTLEEMVNRTNEWYLEKGLALIQKIPTPITPVKMDKEHRQITLAYFDQRSTVDYIGAVQGIPVCFDAKECVAQTFPLQNIHENQVKIRCIIFDYVFPVLKKRSLYLLTGFLTILFNIFPQLFSILLFIFYNSYMYHVSPPLSLP